MENELLITNATFKVGPGTLNFDGNFVGYVVSFAVVFNDETQTWQITKRYSEFHDLYWKLVEQFPELDFPEFPRKIYFGFLSCSMDAVTETRRKAFQKLLFFALSKPQVAACSLFQNFIQQPKLKFAKLGPGGNKDSKSQPIPIDSDVHKPASITTVTEAKPKTQSKALQTKPVDTHVDIGKYLKFFYIVFLIAVGWIYRYRTTDEREDSFNNELVALSSESVQLLNAVSASANASANDKLKFDPFSETEKGTGVVMDLEIEVQKDDDGVAAAAAVIIQDLENQEAEIQKGEEDEKNSKLFYYVVVLGIALVGKRAFEREEPNIEKSEIPAASVVIKVDEEERNKEGDNTVFDKVAPEAETPMKVIESEEHGGNETDIISEEVTVSKPKKFSSRTLFLVLLMLVFSARTNGFVRFTSLLMKAKSAMQ